jgi:hypothetical protein
MGHLVYDTYEGIAQITVRGTVTPALVVMLLSQHLALGGHYIINLTRADLGTLRGSDVRSIVHHARARSLPENEVRIALVAEAPATYGLCRMFQQSIDASHRVGVHLSRAAAAGWLNLELAEAAA